MPSHTLIHPTVQPTPAHDGTPPQARMLVSWLVLWILVLPLMHVHIQADRQQGLPHNVLAGDLPGEFVSPSDAFVEATRPSGIPAPPHLAAGLSYPELAFTAPVPSKHQWLFQLTAILSREVPAEDSAATVTLTTIPLIADDTTPSRPSSPRAALTPAGVVQLNAL